jgi:hypothetical protein
MRDLCRALRGELDPAALFSAFNTVLDSGDPSDEAVKLAAWSESTPAAKRRRPSKGGAKP